MDSHIQTKWTPGPWEYNDPETYLQGYGKFSETAVYAPGNAFSWRMAEVAGPSKEIEIANARLIAAAPDLVEPWQAADDKDWDHLFRMLPDSGHGQFWKKVLTEHRAALRKAGME